MTSTCLTGIFPRSEDLIAATRAHDRGRTSREEVESVLRRDVEGVVRLQQEAGCAPLIDGLLSWQDHFRPLVEAWGGLSLGGLQRWFDNNTFYRQPVVEAALEPAPLPEASLLGEALTPGRPRMAVLPGPYTFATLAEDRHYRAPGELVAALADGLSEVCHGLEAAGIAQVQFSEPSLVVSPPGEDGWAAVAQAYEALRRGNGVEHALHVFFAPTGDRLARLLDLPVEVLGLDLYEEDLDVLGDVAFDKILACGCVDARNSLLESPKEIAQQAAAVRAALEPRDLVLCPNADLEFLPRAVGEAKVRALGRALPLLEATE